MVRVEIGMITLRPMTSADLDGVAQLEARIYPQPWSRRVFEEELRAPARTYLVATQDGEIVGYGGLMVVGEDAHVTTVAVAPEARGGSVATRLMLELVDAGLAAGARSLTLEVRTSNAAAQALYRKFGMVPVGVRKNYYRDEDALIMWAHDIDGDHYAERIKEIREALP